MEEQWKPRFSFIVPIFDVEKYLNECLNSLMVQGGDDFEIILIDDGSTNSSGAIADAFEKKYGAAVPIRVIHQENQRLSAARNRGIAQANGTYIICIDSDDCLVPGALIALREKLNTTPYDIVFYKFREFSEKGDGEIRPRTFPDVHSTDGKTALVSLFSKQLENYSWSFAARRELYTGIEFPVGRNYEDKATTYRLIAVSNRIGFIDRVLYRYRQRLGSITHSVSASDIIGEIQTCAEQRSFLAQNYSQLLDLQAKYYAYEFMIDYRNCSLSQNLVPKERRHLQAMIANELRHLAASSDTSRWDVRMCLRYFLVRTHLLFPIQRCKFLIKRKGQ